MIRLFSVSKYFETSPSDVLKWSNPMYLDAREYIDLSEEAIERTTPKPESY